MATALSRALIDKLRIRTETLTELLDPRPPAPIIMAAPELREFAEEFPVDRMLVETHMERFPEDKRAKDVFVVWSGVSRETVELGKCDRASQELLRALRTIKRRPLALEFWAQPPPSS
jgi:hypothetical protein